MADETVSSDAASSETAGGDAKTVDALAALDAAADAGETTGGLKLKEQPAFEDGETPTDDDAPAKESKAWLSTSPLRARGYGLAGLRATNRVLMVVIGLAFLLAAFDLFATIQRVQAEARGLDVPARHRSSPGGEAPETPPPLPMAKYLASFSNRPIVRRLDSLDSSSATQVRLVRTQREPDWKKTAQEHFDLIGLAPAPDGGSEAIVADRETGRTLFLRAGQAVGEPEQGLVVETVGSDHVVLAKGNDRVTIK